MSERMEETEGDDGNRGKGGDHPPDLTLCEWTTGASVIITLLP